MTLALRVWSRQGENTTEYQHCIEWTLKAVKDREQRVKEAGVDGDAEFEGKSKKGREDERNRSRGREGLNFNPRVTEFTDICTRIRLAVPHSFSETTLSLFSIPKTYSSSYILSRMRPFTVLRAEKEKKKHRKANWIECVEFEQCLRDNLQPRMSSRFLVYIVCILMEELTRGEEKNDMWQAIHLSCQHVISTTFKPHVNCSYSLSGEGDLGRNQLTHPDTAGECMEIHSGNSGRERLARMKGMLEQIGK